MKKEDWLSSYKDLPDVGISTCATVDGVCKKARGGRFLYAKVTLSFSKSDELDFQVMNSYPNLSNDDIKSFMEAICLGVMDVMFVKPEIPVTLFRCVIENIDIHPMDSSERAFRLAARAATEEFINQDKFIAA